MQNFKCQKHCIIFEKAENSSFVLNDDNSPFCYTKKPPFKRCLNYKTEELIPALAGAELPLSAFRHFFMRLRPPVRYAHAGEVKGLRPTNEASTQKREKPEKTTKITSLEKSRKIQKKENRHFCAARNQPDADRRQIKLCRR